jgi:hypothetical protein
MNENPEAYLRHLVAKPERKHLGIEYVMGILAQQNGRCAISGVELTFIKRTDGVKQHTNASIDRIDSGKGYEVGNVQLVCAIVNIMKSTMTTNQLVAWCELIVENSNAKS